MMRGSDIPDEIPAQDPEPPPMIIDDSIVGYVKKSAEPTDMVIR